jgi:hypothetical protein
MPVFLIPLSLILEKQRHFSDQLAADVDIGTRDSSLVNRDSVQHACDARSHYCGHMVSTARKSTAIRLRIKREGRSQEGTRTRER